MGQTKRTSVLTQEEAAVDGSPLDAQGLKDYGKLWAWTLAQAQVRSGDRRAIAVPIAEPKPLAQADLEQAMPHGDLALDPSPLLKLLLLVADHQQQQADRAEQSHHQGCDKQGAREATGVGLGHHLDGLGR
jgi:hypothetical protein